MPHIEANYRPYEIDRPWVSLAVTPVPLDEAGTGTLASVQQRSVAKDPLQPVSGLACSIAKAPHPDRGTRGSASLLAGKTA